MVAARQTRRELPAGLADSKKLTKRQREWLYAEIIFSCDLGEGWVSALEIDKFGLAEAMPLGINRALLALRVPTDEEIIMDGTVNYCQPVFTNVRCQPKADADYPLVSAASIYAKVTRDAFMAQQDEKFPQYGFSRHVGYGTPEHIQALHSHGISELHRLSFTPIRALAGI